MPSIYDWSSTAGSNTSINSINIAENCPAANINNAIREVMATCRSTFASGLQNFLAGSSPLAVASGGTGLSAALTTNALVKQGASAFAASIVSDDGATATVTGALSVTGASTLASAGVTGNATVGGTLGVTGASTLTGALSGTSATFSGNATVSGTLRATGLSQFDNGINLKTTTLNYVYFDDALAFSRNSVGERVRIDSSGNVGIGTSSPGAKLDVTTASGSNIVVSRSSAAGYAAFQRAAPTGQQCYDFYTVNGTEVARITSDASNFIAFSTGVSATERVRIDSSGNVGIGTTSPGYKLHVSGGTASASNFVIGSEGTSEAGTIGFTNSNGPGVQFWGSATGNSGAVLFTTGGTERFRITSTGSITSSNLADAVGYKGIPQNSQTASYTIALSDMGKHISITTGGVIIPANASVAFPIGSTVVVYNNSASTQTISITTDTLRLAGTATTGSRTLAAFGIATLIKVASTEWVSSGNVT